MSALWTASLVAARIASTSWANVVQKRMLHASRFMPLDLFVIEWGWMTLLSAPWWLSTFSLSLMFWFWMLLTCILEVPGNVMLLRSLRSTELSIFGPLASIKPVISLLLSFLLFAEVPGWFGILGVLVVLLGSAILTSEPRSSAAAAMSRSERRRGIRDRLLSTVMTAMASVFLKQALTLATEWQALAAWCVTGWAIATAWGAAGWLRSNRLKRPLDQFTKRDLRATFLVATALLLMQGCTIALFARMNVGYALALFQIGSLVSVFLGHRLFGEAHLVRRLIAATIMVVGAVIIVTCG